MATWKKVIVSGSNAELAQITSSILTTENELLLARSQGVTGSSITVASGDVNFGSLDLVSTGAASIISGSFSGSFEGDGSGLTGLATNLAITSSEGTSGSIDLLTQGLSFSAGEGVDISISGQTVTFAGEDASDSNKGIASFDNGDFSVSSGNVALADSATGAVIGINGTTNEVEVSRTNGTVTIGLPDSVTIATASIQNNLTVGGDLTVNGDLTYLNTSNLFVEDKFILLNSGSANPDEGGIIIDEGGSAGHAFVYDSDAARFAFTGSLAHDATSVTPDAFVAAVIDEGAGHTDKAEYQKAGNIKIDSSDNIWIYV